MQCLAFVTLETQIKTKISVHCSNMPCVFSLALFEQPSQSNMSFGSSWCQSTWSKSFSGTSYHDNKEAEGTHCSSCQAGSRDGWMNSCYDEKCSGCRHGRSRGGKSKGNSIADVLGLVGGDCKEYDTVWGWLTCPQLLTVLEMLAVELVW